MAKPGRVIKRTAQGHTELTAEDINNWRKLSLDNKKFILTAAINKKNPDNDFYTRYLGNVLALMTLDFEGKTPQEPARWEPYLDHVGRALESIHGTRPYIHIVRGGIFKEDLAFCILCRVIERMPDEHRKPIVLKLQGERGWDAFQKKSKEHNLGVFNPRLELSALWVKNLRFKIQECVDQEEEDQKLISSYAHIGAELEVLEWISDDEKEENSPQAAAVNPEKDESEEVAPVDSAAAPEKEEDGWVARARKSLGLM